MFLSVKLFWFVALASSGVISQDDICDNAINIGNDKRHVDYNLRSGDEALCDRDFVTGIHWYSLESDAGSVIPEFPAGSSIPLNRCGTFSPGWIRGNDVHPQGIGHETIAEVCFNDGGGCDTIESVRIYRCSEEKFVYMLAAPIGCPSAYCVGGNQVCFEPHQRFDPDKGECVDVAPEMQQPTLSGPTLRSDGRSFYFSCNINYTLINNTEDTQLNPKFIVTFLFDGVEIPDGDPIDADTWERYRLDPIETDWQQLEVKLEDHFLLGRMGRRLSCKVQAFYENHREDISDGIESAPYQYRTGIQHSPEGTLRITDDNPVAEVELVSTVPVIPPLSAPCDCILVDVLTITDGVARCTFHLRRQAWIDYTGPTDPRDNAVVKVSAPTSGVGLNYAIAVDFEPMRLSGFIRTDPHRVRPIFNGHQVPSVMVHFELPALGHCFLFEDPHVITFDGKRVDCLDLGVFYLAKSLDTRIFEVQGSFWGWANGRTNAGAICGVAVREGNHILGVTMCRSRHDMKRYPVRQIRYQLDLSTRGGHIERDANIYTITMASGARVVATAYDDYMDVHIHPHPRDKGKMSGLCGNFDGNRDNDRLRRNNHCPEHRVPRDKDIFASPPACIDHEIIVPSCECNKVDNSVVCDLNAQTALESSQYVCNKGERSKRATGGSIGDNVFDDEELFVDMPYVESDVVLEWPTSSGIDETEAKAACLQVMEQSPVFDACQDEVNLEELIDTCAMDIQITDTTTGIGGYIDVFQSMCTIKAASHITLNTTDPEEQAELLAPVQEIERDICPNQCSGRGHCHEGKCQCQEGYTREDCSMAVDATPKILGLRNHGVCDRRQRQCQTVRMFADNLDTSREIMCKIRETRKNVEGLVQTVREFESSGTIYKNMEVGCPLPPSPVMPDEEYDGEPVGAVSYAISISNDGTSYSQPEDMRVYDSLCMTCGESSCSIKDDTCFISGLCKASKEIHHQDLCSECDPSRNSNQWSHREDTEPAEITGPTDFYKYEGEELNVDLDILEHDGLNSTVSYTGTNDHISISKEGHISWGATGTQNTTVEVVLTNQCGAISVWELLFYVYYSYWSGWGDWGACSRECDYGVKESTRNCLSSAGCPSGSDTRLDFCHEKDCPAREEEAEQGVAIRTSTSDAIKLMNQKDELLSLNNEAINDFFKNNPKKSCEASGFTGVGVKEGIIATDGDTSIAAGFPSVMSEYSVLKLVTKVERKAIEQFCEVSRNRRSADQVFINPNIMIDAVIAYQSNIEKSLGVKILEVSSGVIEPSPQSDGLYIIIGLVIGTVVICAALLGVIVYKAKSSKYIEASSSTVYPEGETVAEK